MKKYIHNYYAIFRLGLQHKNCIFTIIILYLNKMVIKFDLIEKKRFVDIICIIFDRFSA